MRIKKLFVLLFSVLTLSLCQCRANPNTENNNGENGNNNPPIDQPEEDIGGIFNETLNEGSFNDDVKASQIKDDGLLTYIEENKDKDIIDLSKEQFIQLVQNNEEEYLTGKPTVFYDENNELIYAGTLSSYIDEASEDSEYKYTLRRAYMDEVLDKFDYNVTTEKDETVQIDENESLIDSKETKQAKSIYSENKERIDPISLDLDLKVGLNKEWSNKRADFKVGNEVNIKVRANITNLNVGLNWDIWSNNHLTFNFSFDYDFQFYFLLNSTAKVSPKHDIEEKIDEKLKPSAKLNSKLNSISDAQTSLIQLDFGKLDEALQNDSWDIPNLDEGGFFKGISGRTLEVEFGRINLPPCILGGFEQVINQVIYIPIIGYIDFDGFADLKLSTLYDFQYKGSFATSYDNHREEPFMKSNNIEKDKNELETSFGGEAELEIQAGVAVQLNIFGQNIAETTIYLDLLTKAKVSFAFDWDVKRNNQAVYFAGALGLDLSIKWDVNINFKFCFGFFDIPVEFHFTLLDIPLFAQEFLFGGDTEFGYLQIFHSFVPIDPSQYAYYDVQFDGLFSTLPITDGTIEKIQGNISKSILYETSVYDLKVNLDEIGFVSFNFALVKNPLVSLDRLKFKINDKEYIKEKDEIIISNERINFRESFDYSDSRVKVSVTELTLSFSKETINYETNLIETSLIDFSPNKPTSISIVSDKMILETKDYEFVATFDNPFEFDIKSFKATFSGGESYTIKQSNFLKYTKYEIRFKLTLPHVTKPIENVTLNISDVTFSNKFINYVSKDSVSTTFEVNSYGDGSEGNPYKIDTVDRFFDVMAKEGFAILIEDIDFDAITYWTGLDKLTVSLDGQNHKITNLRLRDDGSLEVALFDEIPSDKYIRNIRFENCSSYTQYPENSEGSDSSEDLKASFITITNKGLLSNIEFVSCKTSSESYGGLVSCFNEGTIENIKVNNCSIFSDESYAGIITGYNRPNGKILNCEIIDSRISGNYFVGGCAGYNSGQISKIVIHDMHIVGEQYLGGIIGYNDTPNSEITSVYFAGEIIGDDYIGGLIGYLNSGNLSNYDYYKKNNIICSCEEHQGVVAGGFGKGVVIA